MSSKMITHPVKFKKTCREYLPELMGRSIKLGFDKGSSFVFCKVVDADTEAELGRIQNEIRDHIIHRGMKAALEHKLLLDTGFEKWYQTERDKAKKKYDSYKNHIKPWEEPDPVKMAQKYEAKLKYCEKAIDRGHKYEGMPDFLLGALVAEQYPSIDPECRGTLIILLAGDAVGGYWTESEYLNGRPEYNDGEDDDEKDLMDVALEEVRSGL